MKSSDKVVDIITVYLYSYLHTNCVLIFSRIPLYKTAASKLLDVKISVLA